MTHTKSKDTMLMISKTIESSRRAKMDILYLLLDPFIFHPESIFSTNFFKNKTVHPLPQGRINHCVNSLSVGSPNREGSCQGTERPGKTPQEFKFFFFKVSCRAECKEKMAVCGNARRAVEEVHLRAMEEG